MHARMITTTLAALLLAIPATTVAQSANAPGAVMLSSASGVSFSQSTPEPARAPRGSGSYEWQAPQATTAPPQPSGGSTAPQMPRVPMARMQRGQLLNVKVEFTITDQLGAKPAIKKTMTMVVADGESSRIRTNVDYYTARGNRSVPLAVDVSPTIEGNKIRLDFSIDYATAEEPASVDEKLAPAPKTSVSERLAAVLDSGVPLVVAQSSDAYSDRRVTVEIKATILK